MESELTLSGELEKGEGRASFFTELDWVQRQLKEKFGFFPFPGTLNLKVSQTAMDRLAQLPRTLWRPLLPPDSGFCSADGLPCYIRGTTAMIIKPEQKKNIHHGRSILEIISPLCLRQVYHLKNGDEVSALIKKDPEHLLKKRLNVKAVLFDLDGTLVDSIESYYRIVEAAIENLGYPEVSREKIAWSVKNTGFDWKGVLPPMDEAQFEEKRKKAWQITEQLYSEMFFNRVELFSDTGDVFKKLHAHGIRIGIVTATPKKNMNAKLSVLEQGDLLPLVDVVICSDDTVYKKPYPDPLLRCCRKMGLEPKDCAYVGDVGNDMIAAKAAGMMSVGVTTGFETRHQLLLHRPDSIIDSVGKLSAMI